MPRKGGKEAYDEMRRMKPGLKVIFMSGYTADSLHESFVLTVGVPFLVKPFGRAALARKVRGVLDRKQDGTESHFGVENRGWGI